MEIWWRKRGSASMGGVAEMGKRRGGKVSVEEEREKVEKGVRVGAFYSVLVGPKSRLGFRVFGPFKLGWMAY